jgi:hypothetical protein
MRGTPTGSTTLKVLAIGVLAAALAAPALAGFAGTDLFVPMAGRGPGDMGSQWFTTLYVYNPSASPVSVTIYFLKRTNNNFTNGLTPKSYTINAGETKVFPNIVEAEFAQTVFGALRITCDTPVYAVARVYAAASAAAPLNNTYGQDFSAVPSSFAIGKDESTEVLGGYQTIPTNTSAARFNVGFVEVTGNSVTVTWTVKNAAGTTLASFPKPASALDQAQGSFANYFPGVSLDNARITATVTSGKGKVIPYGSMVANSTNDPTTYEAIYPANLLPKVTGVYHGAVWSTDGLVVEGGVELNISETGVVSYSGSAGLQCGDELYTLDFSDTPASPVAIDATGAFTAPVLTIGYEDGGATVFTTQWTFAGTIDKFGILTGTLKSTTTGGTGTPWSDCNGANVSRNWRAAWTQNPT